jgi:hypothetical protein
MRTEHSAQECRFGGTRMSLHLSMMLLCLGAVCCGDKEVSMDGSNVIIDKCGSYGLKGKAGEGDESLRLSIWIDGHSVVQYEVLDGKDQNLVRSDAGGNFSRWYFCWDSGKSQLWVFSGDIGAFVWRRAENGVYKRELVEKGVVKEMPDLFYGHASSATKREWDKQKL